MELTPWNTLETGETREPGNSFYLDCYHFLLRKKRVQTKKKKDKEQTFLVKKN